VADKENTKTEEFVVDGEKLLAKVKELIKEGNVTRIIIKNKEDKVLVEFPVTVGVVGVVLAPFFAAVGAIAALVTECKVVVVRRD
jgi:putative cell wall-binding protein